MPETASVTCDGCGQAVLCRNAAVYDARTGAARHFCAHACMERHTGGACTSIDERAARETAAESWYQAATADAQAKAALFAGASPRKRVHVLAQAGRVGWQEQPYVLAQMEAAIAEAVEAKLAKVREAALRLIEVAEKAADRYKPMPFVNDRAVGGMLGQEAENLRQVLGIKKKEG